MKDTNQPLAFLFDSTRCSGCKACSIACKDKNGLPIGVMWRKVLESTRGDWLQHPDGTYSQDISAYYMSISCNHCEKASCITACPTGAMQRAENGIVIIDADRCVGCGNCKWNCPYSAPQLNLEQKHMTKCDFCRDFLAVGREPACVQACPSRALHIMPRADVNTTYTRGDVAPLPEAAITEPNLCVIPHKKAIPAKGAPDILANREELGHGL